MTNCNCECLCQEMENWQGGCICCVCDFDNDDSQDVVVEDERQPERQPSLEQLKEFRKVARDAFALYQNLILTFDEQQNDAQWKKQQLIERARFCSDEVVRLTIAIENY